MSGDQSMWRGFFSSGSPATVEKAMAPARKTAISPSSMKTISRVWARMAGMSEATKNSSLPRPTTMGEPSLAAIRVSGSFSQRMQTA